MLLEQTSEEFRKLFLLKFTEELIKNIKTPAILQLEAFLRKKQKEAEEIKKQQKKQLKEIVRKVIHPQIRQTGDMKQVLHSTHQMKTLNAAEKALQHSVQSTPQSPAAKLSQKPQRPQLQVLRIPEPKLPERLSYLKPIPTEKQIDLGKLNPLVNDPFVKSIECHGPDTNIIVRTPQPKTTNISLTKEEIDDIIKRFSEAAKIPVEEGVFRVAFGKLMLLAIVSEVIGSKFIIKKLSQPRQSLSPPFRPNKQLSYSFRRI